MSKRLVRLGFIIVLLALIGAAISGLIGWRAADQELTIDRIALARAIDVHASLVQDRLTERELLARVAAGLFRPGTVGNANMLEPLRASIYAFKTDFVVASWIAHLNRSQLPRASAELAASSFPKPQLRRFDDAPLPVDFAETHSSAEVLMDVEPRNAETLGFPGRVLGDHSAVGPMLARAAEIRKPVSSDPVILLRQNGPIGIALGTPVVPEGNTEVAGFVTFSYEIGSLMLTNDELSLFSVALKDPREANSELVADERGKVSARAETQDPKIALISRAVSFGDRDWTLLYYPKSDAQMRAMRIGAIFAGLGLLLTALICGTLGYVSYNNVRLSREIDVRIGYERRLTAVIDELNHRVKNILAVIQSIVTRTLRHGSDVEIARDLLIGRIHAMSNVVTLLSESQWQGVKLKGLFEARAIPNAERIAVSGPDVTVSARAAQSLSLLFFELASHSDEGLSLVGKHPHVVAKWDIGEDKTDPMFRFHWEEFNTSEATRRPDSDFGLALLDRVAPEALGGTSKRYFTDVSYVYELIAPMETVVDLTERGRTDRLAAPIKPHA